MASTAAGVLDRVMAAAKITPRSHQCAPHLAMTATAGSLRWPDRRPCVSHKCFPRHHALAARAPFAGETVSSPKMYQGRGFSGLKGPQELAGMRRNSTHGALLMHFDTDFSQTESGFLFGWTRLPLPPASEGCALDCTEERHRPSRPAPAPRDSEVRASEARINSGWYDVSRHAFWSQEKLNDDKCDPECMNAFCGWDRGGCDVVQDCATGCSTTDLGNDVCDSACLNSGRMPVAHCSRWQG